MTNQVVQFAANQLALPAEMQASLAQFQSHFDGVVGTAFPPQISTKFQGISVIQAGTVLQNNQDGTMRVVIVDVSPTGQNTYFEQAFRPGDEVVTPKCWSSNGQTPDADVPLEDRQNSNCKNCPMKVDGSNRAGVGKACSFKKRIIVVVEQINPHGEVFFDFASPVVFNVNATSVLGSGKLASGYNLNNYINLLMKQSQPIPPNVIVTTLRRDLSQQNNHVITFDVTMQHTAQGQSLTFLDQNQMQAMMAEFNKGTYSELLNAGANADEESATPVVNTQPQVQAQAPVQQAPAYQQPPAQAPVYQQQAPVQQAPVQQAPVQQAPVQQAPVQQAPVYQQPQAPVQQAPVQQAPVYQQPQAPVQQAPVQQAPAYQQPAQAQAPVQQAPAYQQPAPAYEQPAQLHQPQAVVGSGAVVQADLSSFDV